MIAKRKTRSPGAGAPARRNDGAGPRGRGTGRRGAGRYDQI